MEKADDHAEHIFAHLKPHFYVMCKNRYSCRVAQKMISIYSTHKVNELLSLVHGHEVELIMDPHASHVMQKVVSTQPAKTFGFIVNMVTSQEKHLRQVIYSKFGCRVIQLCLDRLVEICQQSNTKQ